GVDHRGRPIEPQPQRSDDPFDDQPHSRLVEIDRHRFEPTSPFDEGPAAAVQQYLRHFGIGQERLEPAAHAAQHPPASLARRSSTTPAALANGAGRRSRNTPASTARAISARTGNRPTTGTPRTAL